MYTIEIQGDATTATRTETFATPEDVLQYLRDRRTGTFVYSISEDNGVLEMRGRAKALTYFLDDFAPLHVQVPRRIKIIRCAGWPFTHHVEGLCLGLDLDLA
ncbi:hypothetical protein [Tistrella mobilis]|uniref:Uncharacterized protein n=1 Tax=Tistrella mobilis (strain KA081020-065) TaxID=1110502 RepID=I3TGL0_TISMK|nr:hypothetical protein [Tistrella mobilis]AFK51898.1 hypothetical protein TMO_0059 [Tistrella mobilis KA081020-065]